MHLEHALRCPAAERLLSRVSLSVLDPANNLRRLVVANDDSGVSSSPPPAQLCSAGCAGRFCVTAFPSRFTGLRISRPSGEGASPMHHGERNCTSTVSKLSKTFVVSTPHP